MSQNLDARLLPDSVAIGRLSWCCSTRTIGDLRLISDEIVARLAYERALFQPWPYLGQERCRRCRGLLRCLLLIILPAAMTAADLCMGRGHCAEEEQQRHRQPTPRETRPCGVAWWSARLNVIRPVVPGNITLLPLPPYSPELNPVERIWHYLRSHWLCPRHLEKLGEKVANDARDLRRRRQSQRTTPTIVFRERSGPHRPGR